MAGAGDAIPGTYILRTVNGSSLPWTYFTSGAGSPQTVFESAFSSGTLTMPGQGGPGGPIETMIYMK